MFCPIKILLVLLACFPLSAALLLSLFALCQRTCPSTSTKALHSALQQLLLLLLLLLPVPISDDKAPGIGATIGDVNVLKGASNALIKD